MFARVSVARSEVCDMFLFCCCCLLVSVFCFFCIFNSACSVLLACWQKYLIHTFVSNLSVSHAAWLKMRKILVRCQDLSSSGLRKQRALHAPPARVSLGFVFLIKKNSMNYNIIGKQEFCIEVEKKSKWMRKGDDFLALLTLNFARQNLQLLSPLVCILTACLNRLLLSLYKKE